MDVSENPPLSQRRPPVLTQTIILPNPVLPPAESTSPQPTVIRLNPTHCDEKFHRGHVCKARLFVFQMINDEDDELPPQPPTKPELLAPVKISEITYHAFTGCSAPCTLRLQGFIDVVPIHILIDSGSTHNFLQPQLFERLSIAIQPTKPFKVIVGNSASLGCAGQVQHLQIEVQSYVLTLDCFLLPLQGGDLVLDIQCLETLGTCTINYRTLTMSFQYGPQHITLQGNTESTLANIDYPQLHHMWRQDDVAYCLQLTVIPPVTTDSTVATVSAV